jgi:starch synthase
MRVLHLTPELAPWSKSGGLGDATAALAKSLALLGHEVRVVTPLHGSVPGRDAMPVHRDHLAVGVHPAAGCRVRRAPGAHGFEALFLEHEAFYGGRDIYGQSPAAGHRAAFLARAGLDLCLADGWIPDVVHCHDWTVALAPVLLNTVLRDSPLGAVASVLTLHNLQHQGLHGREIAAYLGLPDWVVTEDNLECLGGVNFLKGGLYHATRLTTVSPTYAREIAGSAHGFGLDPVIRHRQADLEGILNGVDAEEWNPTRDPHLAATYSAANPRGKAACKAALQAELGLDPEPGVPLIGVVARLWEQKGLDLALEPLRARLRAGQLQLALLGSGDPALERAYLALAAALPGRASATIGYDNRLAHRIEAGADFFLMPSRFEPCGLNQLYSMAYGTLPIVRRTGGLADTVDPWTPGAPDATGIVFEHADAHAVDWALGQALELRHAHPAEFEAMRIRAMRREFPWSKSAERYVACYAEAVRQRRQAFSAKSEAKPARSAASSRTVPGSGKRKPARRRSKA